MHILYLLQKYTDKVKHVFLVIFSLLSLVGLHNLICVRLNVILRRLDGHGHFWSRDKDGATPFDPP